MASYLNFPDEFQTWLDIIIMMQIYIVPSGLAYFRIWIMTWPTFGLWPDLDSGWASRWTQDECFVLYSGHKSQFQAGESWQIREKIYNFNKHRSGF